MNTIFALRVLQRKTGTVTLKSGQGKADRVAWHDDERRWCREGKLPKPGWLVGIIEEGMVRL